MKRTRSSSRSPAFAGVAVLVVVAGLGGCAGPSAQPAQPVATPSLPATVAIAAAVPGAPTGQDRTLRTADGRERTYRIFVPGRVRSNPGARVPLLVAMHGGFGSGRQFEANSGFNGLAESNSFVVVYPDGTGVAGSGAIRTWNGGDCCGPAAKNDVDDVAFINQLIAEVGRESPIDASRVYAAGHSNGGIMAYRLACELSDRIVAVGVQSASLGFRPCSPQRPVSLIHIHGSADRNVPVAGGTGDRSVSRTEFAPVLDGVTSLAAADGCPGRPTVMDSVAGSAVSVDLWQPCRDESVVEYVLVDGASHAWMGHAAQAPMVVGDASMDLDSSAAIWSFLAARARPGSRATSSP